MVELLCWKTGAALAHSHFMMGGADVNLQAGLPASEDLCLRYAVACKVRWQEEGRQKGCRVSRPLLLTEPFKVKGKVKEFSLIKRIQNCIKLLAWCRFNKLGIL